MQSRSQSFSKIYDSHSWGSESKSGPGSEPAATIKYRRVLESLLHKESVKSVVDIGCGDWASSRLIKWGELHYVGVDLVPALVEALNERFGGQKRTFITGDLVDGYLPEGDLCIIKDVLQHLSNKSVSQVLAGQLSGCRLALLTNDINVSQRQAWWRPQVTRPAPINEDTNDGGFRPLRLREPPFNLQCDKICTYKVKSGTTIFTKEVLLWRNPAFAPQSD